jgi:monoamine oxidase
VAHGDGGVVVTTAAGRYAAAHVVLACPFPPLRRVRFEPALPPVLAAAVAELGYGTITKTALQFDERCWGDGSWTTTDGPVQRVYEPTVAQPGAAGILLAYIGGDGARALPADEAERAERVAAGVAELQPCTAGRPSRRRSVAWHQEPYAGGAYAVYGPGQVTRFWRPLRRPHGPLWLAGEHVATLTGYLEGAARSGAAVAGDILRSLH